MKNKQFLKLLVPSWLVNFVGIAVAVLVTVGVMALSQYQGSQLRQQIFEVQANASTDTTSSTYQNITTNIAHNSLLSNLPLLLTWAAVGLVVYFFAISIAQSFGRAADLRDQLGYVHASRQALLRQTFLILGLRTLATICWLLFIRVSVIIVMPYALAGANVAGQTLSLTGLAYALLAAVVIYTDIYLHAVFLRLIVLRPRVFTS